MSASSSLGCLSFTQNFLNPVSMFNNPALNLYHGVSQRPWLAKLLYAIPEPRTFLPHV